MLIIDGVDDARRRVGTELGRSAWIAIKQGDIDQFATATRDHQWIHVDLARASRTAFGGTIAHGLLTLSLGPALSEEIFEITGFQSVLNYGYERVRFPAPVPVGSRVRLSASLLSLDEVPGGIQLVVRQTFEREGTEKPVCVADQITRWLA